MSRVATLPEICLLPRVQCNGGYLATTGERISHVAPPQRVVLTIEIVGAPHKQGGDFTNAEILADLKCNHLNCTNRWRLTLPGSGISPKIKTLLGARARGVIVPVVTEAEAAMTEPHR